MRSGESDATYAVTMLPTTPGTSLPRGVLPW
jgi:hypothetical protein